LSEKEKRDIVAAVSAEINSVQRVEEKEKSIKASADGKKKPAETIARPAETKTKPIVSQIGTAVKEGENAVSCKLRG
jgi:cytoskeletal protein RodZ